MPTLVLVPTPLHASRAARRLCDAQGGVLFGPQVTTLEALAAARLGEARDPRPILSPLAERLLALEAGREAGGPFAGLAPGAGLARALATALAELRRGEVTAADAEAAAETIPGAAGARLRHLAAALAIYEARLEALGLLDRAATLRAAARALSPAAPADRGSAAPRGGRRGRPPPPELDLLVVDGFSTFSPAEWDLVAGLAARAARSRFHVPALAERPELSTAVEPTLRRVEALHALGQGAEPREVELILDSLEAPERSRGSAALLAAFAGGRPPRAAGDEAGAAAADLAGEVLALAGAGPEGEARLAARTAARLVAAGLDPSDIAVFHPSPRAAAAALREAFAAEGVPFATGVGTPLDAVPVVRLVLAALEAAAGGLDRRAAERLLGSTYLAPARLAGRLGRLLDRAGALDGRSAPEAALRARAGALTAPAAARERARLLEAADGLSDLRSALRPLGAAAPPAVHAARLSGFLEATGLRRRAGRAEPEVAARDLAALARTEEAADELARALTLLGRGADPLAPAAFAALLEGALAGLALPPRGEPAAGAVELWSLEQAPGRTARAALVLGCTRGAFPQPPPAEPLLQEAERQALDDRLRRAAVASAGARRALGLHQATSALAAGREVVALSWPAEGPTGGGQAPAPLLLEALEALGLPRPAPPPAPTLAEARSPRQALAAAVRAPDPAAAARRLAPPLAARATQAAAVGAIERARREDVLARRAGPFAGRLEGAGLAALRARLPEEWSPTLLEAHAACPFRLLLALGLGLDDPEGAGLDIDGRDEGSLLHAVLERWVRERTARRAWPPTGGEADRDELRGAALAVYSDFERSGRIGDPAVWAARRTAVLSRLDRILAGEVAAAGPLVPTLLEHRFGRGAPQPALELAADGEQVLVKGRIDRVDASPERLLVIDYKNARRASRYAPLLDPASFGVQSFQVPLYLLAAQRALPGRAPSATFQLLRSAERLAPVEEGPDEASLAAAVVGAVRAIQGGALPIVSQDCEGCPFGAVCRFQGTAEVGPAEPA